MPISVVDASALGAVVFGEPQAEEITGLLEDALLTGYPGGEAPFGRKGEDPVTRREMPTSRSRRRGHDRFSHAGLALFLTAILFYSVSAGAQSLEPRAYSNLPIGMNFLIAGYAYQQGDVLLDPSLPLKDVNMQIHSAVVAYARSLDLFGKSGKIDLLVPYAWLTGTGKLLEEERSREVSGLADPF